MPETKNPALTAFVEKNYDLIRNLEFISFLIFITGFTLYEFKVTGSNVILIAGVISTVIFLYLQSFKMIEFEGSEAYNTLGSFPVVNFIFRLYYYSLCVLLISMLGLAFDINKGIAFSIVGGISLAAVFILSLFSRMKDKSKVYDLKFYFRMIVCFIFLGILLAEKGVIN